MPRTHVKICGLTRAEDAAAAVAAGADALGAVFAPSKRRVTIAQAVAVFSGVPSSVERWGVFVDAPLEEILDAVEACSLTGVQLSGSEPPGLCDLVPVRTMKAIHVGTDFDINATEPYRGHAAALLLDTLVTGKAGGTSQVFDWQAVGDVPGWAPVFVAGGLDSANVAACIAAVHPYGVDVSSGVEASPGIKDPARIEAFCAAVRAADARESSTR
jgi:phosphoribosylanthranilate isomerase